jgi:hypothetical protein
MEVLKKIPRRYFLYDRKLLAALSRCAWESLNGFLQDAVSEVDPLVCPKCQCPMRVISAIDDCQVIRAILEHLGLWLVRSRPPPKIHNPPVREYAAADLQIQPLNDTIYGDTEYTWDEYIQS